MQFPIKNVALFWNTDTRYDDKWNHPSNTLLYEGQLKRKTMDNYFNRPNTYFYIFKKNNQRGWEFVGKAKSNRKMKVRVMDKKHNIFVAPVWEMTFEPVCSQDHNDFPIFEKIKTYNTKQFLNKQDLFDLLEFIPAFDSMTTGIIPFTKYHITVD